MDHIPTPLGSFPGIPVPLLISSDYDEFSGYVSCPCHEEVSPQAVATLLQSRLYFGFLASFFNTRLSINEFTSWDGARAYVSLSKGLGRLMNTRTPDPTRQHPLLKILIRHTWVLQFKSGWHDFGTPVSEVELSIRLLFHTLAEYCDYFNRGIPLHPMLGKRLKENGWCPSQIRHIDKRIHNEGVAYYLSCIPDMNVKGLDHSECPKTHCKANSVSEGIYQNKHSCAVTSADQRSSSVHKLPSLEPCSLIYVDGQKIRHIIEQGDIPLVSISTSSTGSVKLLIYPATPSDRYVAISHVWSDGLGNPNSNALPECQIQRLADHLTKLPHPIGKSNPEKHQSVLGRSSLSTSPFAFSTYKHSRTSLFWMDTLCIPVGADSKTQQLKNKAINQMAFIYGNSSQVLVLDSGLENLQLATARKSEVLARIYYSGWMGRCWTYQEGSLTPNVYFQCKGGALNPLEMFPTELGLGQGGMDDVLRTQKSGLWPSVASLFAKTVSRDRRIKEDQVTETMIYRYMRGCYLSSTHLSTVSSDALIFQIPGIEDAHWHVRHLVTVWNALTTRSTTKPEDVAIIFANLLGFDSEQVIQYPANERLKVMLLSSDILPMSLLYNVGPRLTESGERMDWWVPTTLGRDPMCELPLMYRDDAGNMVIDRKKGMANLCAPYVLLLHDSIAVETSSFLLNLEGEKWQINCCRQNVSPADGVVHHTSVCLIFHGGDGYGCLLLVAKAEEDSYTAFYDCPIRAIRCSYSPPTTDLEILYTTPITSKTWEIKLLNDAAVDPKPNLLPRIRKIKPASRA